MTTAAPYVCANHPDRPTSLRCNRCEKPICIKCAVLTPTGYRCRECVSGQQKVFETALSRDYVVAFVIAAILGVIGSVIAMYIGFFVLLVAPIAGTIIAESVRFATGKRRSPKLFMATALGVIAGCLPAALFVLFQVVVTLMYGAQYVLYLLPDLLWLAAFGGLAASTAYYRLKGINLKF